MKEDIETLQSREQEVHDSLRNLYDRKDEAREKFLNMDEYMRKAEKEIAVKEAHLEKLRQEYELLKAQEELSTIHKYFPMMKEYVRITQLCEKIGLAFEYIKDLLSEKTINVSSFHFFSPEHNRHFEAKDMKLKIEKEVDNPKKLQVSLNGENALAWFERKYKELQQSIGHRFKPNNEAKTNKSKGFKA